MRSPGGAPGELALPRPVYSLKAPGARRRRSRIEIFPPARSPLSECSEGGGQARLRVAAEEPEGRGRRPRTPASGLSDSRHERGWERP